MKTVNSRRLPARSIVVAIVTALLVGCSLHRVDSAPSFQGFESQEQLIDQFLSAIQSGDQAAMDRLRVTEAEYRDVIIPGSVPVGRTMKRPVSDTKFRFWWSMLDQKSKDFGFVIRREWGGGRWHRVRHWYTKDAKQLTGYRGLGETRIDVEDDQGNRGVVKTGWIAEVAGHYKFIGFEYDD